MPPKAPPASSGGAGAAVAQAPAPPVPAPPRSVAVGRGAQAGGAARQRVAKSLRDVYEESCKTADVHINSALAKALPERHGAPLQGDVLDLSRNYVGDRGIVPVLSIIQRSPHLRRLVLCENGLRNNAVKLLCNVVAKHPSISSLDLSDNYISEGAGTAIEALLAENPRVVEIGFRNTKIDSQEQRLRIKELLERNVAARDSAAVDEVARA
jgi:hypothetical protein